jgi:hypothetical protein
LNVRYRVQKSPPLTRFVKSKHYSTLSTPIKTFYTFLPCTTSFDEKNIDFYLGFLNDLAYPVFPALSATKLNFGIFGFL